MSSTIPELSKNKISILALILITIVTISYQIYISSGYVSDDEMSFADFSFGLGALAVGIVALFVAKRYRGVPVLGKTYFALAMGFIILFVGDLVYNYYLFVLEEDPYPSIADAFFILFYIFTGYHLIKNIKFFKKNISFNSKIAVVGISSIMIGGFGLFTLETLYDDPTVYFMSMAYVVSSAVILALAILAFTIFQKSTLGIAWGFIVSGIIFYSIGDIWYYYLEEIEIFSITDPVNTLWMFSNALMIYGLYLHRKTF